MTQRNPRRSAAEWATLVADYRDSGLSIQAYCDEKHIVAATFHKWKRRLSSSSTARSSQKPAFVPVACTDTTPPAVSSVTVQIGPSITLSLSIPGVSHEH